MTQQERIIDYIDRFGSITPMQAFNDLGITKLATRLSEMRKSGYTFDVEIVKNTNRFGEPVRYACYSNLHSTKESI